MTPLKPFTFYILGGKEGVDKLYWRLRGISKIENPQLGNLTPLPDKEQKTMFFFISIDLVKWNTAQLRDMPYLYSPGYAAVLGLLYHNYAAAKAIFTDWKTDVKNKYSDEL